MLWLSEQELTTYIAIAISVFSTLLPTITKALVLKFESHHTVSSLENSFLQKTVLARWATSTFVIFAAIVLEGEEGLIDSTNMIQVCANVCARVRARVRACAYTCTCVRLRCVHVYIDLPPTHPHPHLPTPPPTRSARFSSLTP